MKSAAIPVETWQLATRRLGRQTLICDCVDSTNTLALARADDSRNDGLVIVARAQSAGRGQYGRSWAAPPGSSVLLSVLLFPPPELRRPALLTAWAAVSVCRLIRQTIGQQAKIKWPNDVLIRGRKVCGILIEQRSQQPDTLAAVVGIGLNVRQSETDFVAAGLPQAGSLAMFAAVDLDAADVAKLLIHVLDDEYCRLIEGDRHTLEECWKRHLEVLGKQVVIEGIHETVRGHLGEIAFDGLRLELPDQAIRMLTPESVRHISAE